MATRKANREICWSSSSTSSSSSPSQFLQLLLFDWVMKVNILREYRNWVAQPTIRRGKVKDFSHGEGSDSMKKESAFWFKSCNGKIKITMKRFWFKKLGRVITGFELQGAGSKSKWVVDIWWENNCQINSLIRCLSLTVKQRKTLRFFLAWKVFTENHLPPQI